MPRIFWTFLRKSDGSVSADWVLLTAGIVAIAMFIISPYGLAPYGVQSDINESLADAREDIFADDILGLGGDGD